MSGPIDVVRAFNDALNRGDVDAMMARLTEDSVFENTFPSPDGSRLEGHRAIRRFWEEFFRGSLEPRIEIEEVFAADDRCVMRWTYRWHEPGGTARHIRGVDVYRIHDGKIAEKLSYVKG
jgi:limonene-1,2-epoxide hydrolase